MTGTTKGTTLYVTQTISATYPLTDERPYDPVVFHGPALVGVGDLEEHDGVHLHPQVHGRSPRRRVRHRHHDLV